MAMGAAANKPSQTILHALIASPWQAKTTTRIDSMATKAVL